LDESGGSLPWDASWPKQRVLKRTQAPPINAMEKLRSARDFDLRLPLLSPDLARQLTPGGVLHDLRNCPRVISHLSNV
jgi:hypothetical protein